MGPVDPIAFEIGPLAVRWYGLLIVVGALLGGLAAAWQAKSFGDDPDHVWNMLSVCLVLGIIGGRLYHVFSTPAGGALGWPFYREHPGEIFAFWHGGLQGFGIYGAVAGGILGVWVYTRLARLPFLRWLDHATVGLILAQAVGRWGNYFNQELYGPPTSLPWGIYIEPAYRLNGLQAFERFHPVFLYESILDLAIFVILVWASRHFRERLRDGDVFLGYLILYPFVRFWIEFLRPDAWKIAGVAMAQIIAVACMASAAVALWLRHGKRGALPDAADAPPDDMG
jgi:phosphatidylglycerol---prolipoprotein diacylglyceryl transferase